VLTALHPLLSCLIVLFGFLLTGCESDPLDNDGQPTVEHEVIEFSHYGTTFKVIDNRVSFESLSDATAFFEAMQKDPSHEEGPNKIINEITSRTSFKNLNPLEDILDVSDETFALYEAKVTARLDLFQEVYSGNLPQDKNADFETDEFIDDHLFAGFLNIDGEIVAGNQIYHYTPMGLFITNISDNDKFMTIYSQPVVLKGILEATSETGSNYDVVAEGVTYFRPKPVVFSGPDSDTMKDPSSQKDLDEDRLIMCEGSRSSTAWNVFGPSSDCSDHFERNRRVKTKIWRQNYGLVSSLGMSVRSQRRRFGVWWASSVDELELGASFMDYEFPVGQPLAPPEWAFAPNSIFGIELDDGTLIDFSGRVVNSGPLFTRFGSISRSLGLNPSVDEGWVQARVFINVFGTTLVNREFSAADYLNIGSQLDDLIRSGVPSLLRSVGQVEDQNLELIDIGNEVMMVVTRPIERNRRNIANMAHYFDFNTGQIGISGSVGDLGIETSGLLSAYDYDILRGLVWGAGRRGSTTKGNYVGMSAEN
jgi:hypothetical protein